MAPTCCYISRIVSRINVCNGYLQSISQQYSANLKYSMEIMAYVTLSGVRTMNPGPMNLPKVTRTFRAFEDSEGRDVLPFSPSLGSWQRSVFDLTCSFPTPWLSRVVASMMVAAEFLRDLWTSGTSSFDFNDTGSLLSILLRTLAFAMPLKSSRVVPECKFGL
jgi:hypothetical protein